MLEEDTMHPTNTLVVKPADVEVAEPGADMEEQDWEEDDEEDDELDEEEQVLVEWKGWQAKVGKGLAPLILSLWKNDIHTFESWQNEVTGRVSVGFVASFCAVAFLNIVNINPDMRECRSVGGTLYYGDLPFWQTLYQRTILSASDDAWKYRVTPQNWVPDPDPIKGQMLKFPGGGTCNFEFMVRIDFPTSDLPIILERLTAALAKRATSTPAARS